PADHPCPTTSRTFDRIRAWADRPCPSRVRPHAATHRTQHRVPRPLLRSMAQAPRQEWGQSQEGTAPQQCLFYLQIQPTQWRAWSCQSRWLKNSTRRVYSSGSGPSRPGRGKLPRERLIRSSWPSKIRTNESGRGRSNCSSKIGRGRLRQRRVGNEARGSGVKGLQVYCKTIDPFESKNNGSNRGHRSGLHKRQMMNSGRAKNWSRIAHNAQRKEGQQHTPREFV